jgi:hypothetical protein
LHLKKKKKKLAKICQEKNSKFLNKKKWFWRFSIAKSEKINYKNYQIPILGFHCVTKNIEGWLEICTLILVYIPIWLNLLWDGHHFSTCSHGWWSSLWLQTKFPEKGTAKQPPKSCVRTEAVGKCSKSNHQTPTTIG